MNGPPENAGVPMANVPSPTPRRNDTYRGAFEHIHDAVAIDVAQDSLHRGGSRGLGERALAVTEAITTLASERAPVAGATASTRTDPSGGTRPGARYRPPASIVPGSMPNGAISDHCTGASALNCTVAPAATVTLPGVMATLVTVTRLGGAVVYTPFGVPA